jgi:hypothetical protein
VGYQNSVRQKSPGVALGAARFDQLFEPLEDGQQSWSNTGLYDANVVSTSLYGFGLSSEPISSGCRQNSQVAASEGA